MQTISVRVPDDDLAWLLGLEIDGARNPSDRIRSLIAATRRQREGVADFVACTAMLREFLRPFLETVRAAERRHGVHSEVVSIIAESLPEIMAETIAFEPTGEDDSVPAVLARVESGLAARSMRMLIRLLRLAVTQHTPAYTPAVLDPHLDEVIEIAKLVNERRTQNVAKEA
jgi:hypothetical protein